MPLLMRARNLFLLPLMTLVLLAALTALGPISDASAASKRTSRAASVAMKQIGDPYRYGATGPGAFDCSGLVQYSFRRAGIKMPRTASQQAQRAHRIPRKKLRRGDLMFFNNGSRVYHAGVFLKWSRGRAMMVHAPSTGKRVQVASAWTNGWFAGTVRR